METTNPGIAVGQPGKSKPVTGVNNLAIGDVGLEVSKSKLRAGKPWAFVTWLTPFLAGTRHCQFAPWFASRFKMQKPERGADLIRWTAEHGAMVRERAEYWRHSPFQAEPTLEDQNAFRWHGKTVILAGKPDLVISKFKTIEDVKTGKRRDEHWFQAMIYLLAWPKAIGQQMERASLIYREGPPVHVQWSDINESNSGLVFSLLRLVGGEIPPPKVPSARECARCDVRKEDCPERIDEPEAIIEPSLLAEEF